MEAKTLLLAPTHGHSIIVNRQWLCQCSPTARAFLEVFPDADTMDMPGFAGWELAAWIASARKKFSAFINNNSSKKSIKDNVIAAARVADFLDVPIEDIEVMKACDKVPLAAAREFIHLPTMAKLYARYLEYLHFQWNKLIVTTDDLFIFAEIFRICRSYIHEYYVEGFIDMFMWNLCTLYNRDKYWNRAVAEVALWPERSKYKKEFYGMFVHGKMYETKKSQRQWMYNLAWCAERKH